MDIIITFFRDILDGPTYIVVAVISGILLCACIGYLAEKSQKKRALKEQYVDISKEQIPVSIVASTSVLTSPTMPGEQVKPQVVSVTVTPTRPQPIPVTTPQAVNQAAPVVVAQVQPVQQVVPIPNNAQSVTQQVQQIQNPIVPEISK